jgi:glycosyltransferase involved in cell wall biosynthesis
MKICFLVELPRGFWQWADGLYAAMKILEKDFRVTYHLDGKCDCPFDRRPDIVMAWGGTMSRPYNNAMNINAVRILLFAGGLRSSHLFDKFNITCFENEQHTLEAKALGIHCITAFGTNTQVFRPIIQPKLFDVVYPGAFGLWKRKDLFAKSVKGLRALTFGNVQLHEMECWNICTENNVAVSPDLPQEVVPYYLAMARCVVVLPVPFIGGQRTVLEAMAMKLPVIVPNDAPLVCEFAQHGGMIVEPNPEAIRNAIKMAPPINETGYKYVMKNFTEVHYANKLKEAIERCLV